MTSQLIIFRAFFFRPPDTKSEKNSRKSTNKKILALLTICMLGYICRLLAIFQN